MYDTNRRFLVKKKLILALANYLFLVIHIGSSKLPNHNDLYTIYTFFDL